MFARLVLQTPEGLFLLISAQCFRMIYNPTVPEIFPQTTRASWGSVAPVNQQRCPLSHQLLGPHGIRNGAADFMGLILRLRALLAKGNSSRKRRKLSHPLRGKLVSLNSTGFQDKTLCNTQKAQSGAYIRTPPQINCPQPQSPLQSVGLVHEEGRTVLWLNEQAESQQSLIQPLLCHRLPSMTLEMFLHLQFNEVSKDLAGPAQCRYPCPAAAELVLFGETVRPQGTLVVPRQSHGGANCPGSLPPPWYQAIPRLEVPLPWRGCSPGTVRYRRHKLGTSGQKLA